MSVVFAPQTLLILVQNFSDFRVWFSMGSLKKLSKRKCYRWKKKKKKKKGKGVKLVGRITCSADTPFV